MRRRKSPTKTLGDLLYADRSKVRVSEKEWIDLVASIARGDQHALYVLYERSHRLVFTLLVRITNDPAAAEELTVDVFHDVWRRAATYDAATGTVLAWIMNQARSRGIDRVRFEQRKKRAPRDADDAVAARPADGPEDLLGSKEEARILREAMADLTPAERETIENAFFGELTYREVAARLEAPLGTVKTRVRSALAKLREALKARPG